MRRTAHSLRATSPLRMLACSTIVIVLTLASSPAAHSADCSLALPDSVLTGTMLENLPPGSSILFWGDSVTARGLESNFAKMLVRILNASFARFCDDGSTSSSPSLHALMRGRARRNSYQEANELRTAVVNLVPRWVVVQDAGASTLLAPASGNGFGDDVQASIDAVFGPTSG
ncbi:MAG: hypothetical protein HY899_04040, partial [Deltaproteobacteria bacterium]|nr:hypothetical protein [Deltaproteobacteria bacterium]